MATFSIGYNFDLCLLDRIAELNATHAGNRIGEVFAALKIGPVPSARPKGRIPDCTIENLYDHVLKAKASGLVFNYLMNTSVVPCRSDLRDWLCKLSECGIENLTVGSASLARLIHEVHSGFDLTFSLTARVASVETIRDAVSAGIQRIYLDAASVNRDFELLRRLVGVPGVQYRLYANVSCISHCPAMNSHYRAFERSDEKSSEINNLLFFSCSMVKAKSPTEWMQMPWIRPEDIAAYEAEGIDHFKLSDRLASTSILLAIARAYLSGVSPSNLFPIIERDGAKYRDIWASENGSPYVASKCIPDDWLQHFMGGNCISRDVNCPVCRAAADLAISTHGYWPDVLDSAIERVSSIPRSMKIRLISLS